MKKHLQCVLLFFLGICTTTKTRCMFENLKKQIKNLEQKQKEREQKKNDLKEELHRQKLLREPVNQKFKKVKKEEEKVHETAREINNMNGFLKVTLGIYTWTRIAINETKHASIKKRLKPISEELTTINSKIHDIESQIQTCQEEEKKEHEHNTQTIKKISQKALTLPKEQFSSLFYYSSSTVIQNALSFELNLKLKEVLEEVKNLDNRKGEDEKEKKELELKVQHLQHMLEVI